MTETLINELERPLAFGRIVVSLKENGSYGQYDRLVHDGNTLKLVSLVAEPSRIKAMRAMFGSNTGTASIKVSGRDGATKLSSYQDYTRSEPGWMSPCNSGYMLQHHKMQFGNHHALFISKDPNFLVQLSPDSLWAALSSPRFTTPLLREWMPWVTAQLIKEGLLKECRCFRAVSGVLRMKDSAPLDEIVTKGIQSGELKFTGA